MLVDSDIENRRLGLTTLNSAAHNKMNLIQAHLTELFPLVIQESKIKPELIKEVQMGPFKHKVDDGLEARKSAYETILALIETAYSFINSGEAFERVLAGLSDDHDIQLLCVLILNKLVVIDPEETQRRQDNIAEGFRAILSVKPKDTAVKQEFEKSSESIRTVLSASVQLQSAFSAASIPSGIQDGWNDYYRWIEVNFSTKLSDLNRGDLR
jgi:cullin-associated NEDD8-dissociated protein 1